MHSYEVNLFETLWINTMQFHQWDKLEIYTSLSTAACRDCILVCIICKTPSSVSIPVACDNRSSWCAATYKMKNKTSTKLPKFKHILDNNITILKIDPHPSPPPPKKKKKNPNNSLVVLISGKTNLWYFIIFSAYYNISHSPTTHQI